MYQHTEKDGVLSYFMYVPNFLDEDKYQQIKNELDGIDDWKIGYAYNNNLINRKQKWYQTENNTFCKSWKKEYERWKSHEYSDTLFEFQNYINNEIKKYLPNHESIQDPTFNSLLINYYENGNNHITAHQDNKQSFGLYPTIALISVGSPRTFYLERTYENNLSRNKDEVHLNREFKLEDNSLFIMAGGSQRNFCHSIVKEPEITNSRYSLTFRQYLA